MGRDSNLAKSACWKRHGDIVRYRLRSWWPQLQIKPEDSALTSRQTTSRSSWPNAGEIGSRHSGCVGKLDKPVLVSDHVRQIPPLLCYRTIEQTEPFPQQDGRNRQLDFIHETKFEKALAQHRSPYEPDVSIARRELFLNECLQIARIELDTLRR